MTTVFLALGSNVGDSLGYITAAIEQLGENVTHIVQAPIYRSHAAGYTDQADFLNTAISGETKLTPQELLLFVKEVEKTVGRIERFRWGPREIDIDIIFYGNQIISENNLVIPHQKMAERDFVLQPLLDLNSKLRHPQTNEALTKLLEVIPQENRSIFTTG